jgi:hypothetical protein
MFSSVIFNALIFNGAGAAGAAPPVVVVKTGTGGIDPGEVRRRGIVKPTGILHLPKKKEGRKDVEDRVDESRGIQAEIAARLAREFTEETAEIEARPPIVTMTIAQVDAEIGFLLRKKLRTDEDEVILLLLMVAASES